MAQEAALCIGVPDTGAVLVTVHWLSTDLRNSTDQLDSAGKPRGLVHKSSSVKFQRQSSLNRIKLLKATFRNYRDSRSQCESSANVADKRQKQEIKGLISQGKMSCGVDAVLSDNDTNQITSVWYNIQPIMVAMYLRQQSHWLSNSVNQVQNGPNWLLGEGSHLICSNTKRIFNIGNGGESLTLSLLSVLYMLEESQLHMVKFSYSFHHQSSLSDDGLNNYIILLVFSHFMTNNKLMKAVYAL